MANEFGEALRALRKEAGLTQEGLAEAAKVADRTIRRLESGKTTDSRGETLRLVATALADALKQDPTTLWHELRGVRDGAAGTVRLEPRRPAGPRPLRPRPGGHGLDLAAEVLAHSVQERWTREEEQRRIHDPRPLPVRWHAAADGLFGLEPDLAEESQDAGLSGPWSAARGDLSDITEAYRSLVSGRLAVLGRAGSGKTVVALRFVLDYLSTRTTEEPVPMVFSLGAWDPTAVELRDWLVHRMLRDHPELGAAAPGPSASTLAAALLAAGWILPVLDGFDEIAESRQNAALQALNLTGLPFLLTSRTEEFANAVKATRVLGRAAGVVLDDLTLDDLADYLPDTARVGTGLDGAEHRNTTAWDGVLGTLGRRPDEAECARLLEVLRTPLMVLLARTTYSDVPGRDPMELLDAERFPTADALERHLLAGFVPALYQSPYNPAATGASGRAGRGQGRGRARSWNADEAAEYAAHLAVHLRRRDGRAGQDLAWWRLCDSIRPLYRVLAVVVAGVVATAAAHVLVLVPYDVLADVRYGEEPQAFLADTFFVGPIVGGSFGLVYALTVPSGRFVVEPSRVQIRLSFGRRRTAGPRNRQRFITWLAYGFLGGAVLGTGYGVALTVSSAVFARWNAGVTLTTIVTATLTNMAVFSLIFGFAASFSLGFVSGLSVPDDIGSAPTPLTLLAANRTAAIRQLIALIPLMALAIGASGGLMVTLLEGYLGELSWSFDGAFVIATVGGFVGATTYTLAFTAWGQWLLLTRLLLPLAGRLPWALPAFFDDAYRRGLLRQAGAVYQFRHARLQAQLSAAATVSPSESPRTRSASPSPRLRRSARRW